MSLLDQKQKPLKIMKTINTESRNHPIKNNFNYYTKSNYSKNDFTGLRNLSQN